MGLKTITLDAGFDTRQLRHALGRFPTGVTVITTRAPDGKREGLTANSFSALSLDPPLVLWSIGRKSASLPAFLASAHFAIHVLPADKWNLSHHFATPNRDKFDGLEFQDGLCDSPLLPGVLARFECETHATSDGGDHILFIGRVRRMSFGDGQPLIFSAGHYCTPTTLVTDTAAVDQERLWGGLG